MRDDLPRDCGGKAWESQGLCDLRPAHEVLASDGVLGRHYGVVHEIPEVAWREDWKPQQVTVVFPGNGSSSSDAYCASRSSASSYRC
jgi:hypothetical protein